MENLKIKHTLLLYFHSNNVRLTKTCYVCTVVKQIMIDDNVIEAARSFD